MSFRFFKDVLLYLQHNSTLKFILLRRSQFQCLPYSTIKASYGGDDLNGKGKINILLADKRYVVTNNLKISGFTLLEVVITVAIVGVLASVAYPSFMDSVRKSRRADATTTLLELQLAQEKYRANNTSYAASLTTLGWPSSTSREGFYTLEISAATAVNWSGTAVPKTGTAQANDTCSYGITQDGPDVTTAAKKTCWNKK